MSFQEKRTIVSLISTIVIAGFYFAYVFQRYSLSATNELAFWGAAILILIPVQVVFKVIIHILFIIINTIAEQEAEPPFSDELDRLIELKSTRNFYHVFMVGFLISMGTAVLNMEPSVMFSVLMVSLIVAAVVGDSSQLYFYRRGI